jgi:hypothetical protein
MLSGKASHSTPRAAIGQPSPGVTGRRAADTRDRQANPMAARTKVTPAGAITSRPSAMNRNDAPQMTPGTTSNDREITSRRDMRPR